MVLPITGPFVKTTSPPFTDIYQRGYRQAKPFDRPLEYRYLYAFGTNRSVDVYSSPGGTVSDSVGPIKDTSWSPHTFADFDNKRAYALNKAYEKLKGDLAPSAGWAENIVQAGKSRELIVKSCLTIADVVSSIRHGRFDRAAIALNLIREPKGVSRRKSVAQNFLEFEYGIKPTVKDLQESMQLMLSDPGLKMIKGQAKEHLSLVNNVTSMPSPNHLSMVREVWNGSIDVQLRSLVRVTNPNIFLANQLGLLDLALPWKVLPFSFIVDWFVNVEQVISSVTDWFGVALLHPHTSVMVKGSRTYFSYGYSYNGGSLLMTTSRSWINQSSVEFDRTLGISGPTLQVKPFKGFSLERGAQAISLVLSVFGK